jgi:fatty-acid desaturase
VFRNKRLVPVQLLVIGGLHLSLLLALTHLAHPKHLGMFFFSFCWFCLASNFYYHRCLSHRQFSLNPVLEFFFLVGGLVGLSGDPVQWSTVHRFHHAHSDKDDDAHSPRHGLWWALFGWYLRINATNVYSEVSPASDLLERKVLRWTRGTAPTTLVHVCFAATLYFYGGPSLLLWGLYWPLLASFYAAWALVATLCHLPFLGKQPYPETRDQSRNIAWLAPLTFGEAFHNTHHRYPLRADLSGRWWEIDINGLLFRMLRVLRLAHERGTDK